MQPKIGKRILSDGFYIHIYEYVRVCIFSRLTLLHDKSILTVRMVWNVTSYVKKVLEFFTHMFATTYPATSSKLVRVIASSLLRCTTISLGKDGGHVVLRPPQGT